MHEDGAKTILIYFPTFCRGGIEKNAVYAANLYAANGHNVRFIYTRQSGGQFDQLHPEVEKVRIGGWLNLPLCNRFVLDAASSLLSFFKILIRQKRKNNFVFAFQSNIVAILAAKMTGHKVVVRVSNHPSCAQYNTGWLMPKISEQLKKIFYRFADEIITNSEENSAHFAKMLHREVRTVTNPILQATTETDQKIHPWLAEKSCPVIVSGGRFSTQKDYPTLLEAFALVREKMLCRLVLFGDGSLRGQLEEKACSLGISEDVAMPGFASNLPQQFAHADLFVLSSLFEGLPNVLVEALGAGCPAVSTRCHSGPTEILLDGEAGDLVEIGNAEELAQAMYKNLSDREYAKSKLKTAQNRLDRFSSQTVNRQYLELSRRMFNHG